MLTFPRRVFAARPRADRWTIGRSRGAAAPLAGAIAAAAKRVAWVRAITVPAVVGVLFLAVRYWLARTPVLSETYYDEALTGLMGLAILRGVPQVFYWGEPYGGAIGDAYLAAAGFWLFGPSTLVLRMSAIVVIVLWAWAVWSIARRIGGEGCGWLAGLYIAVPPVFLSYVQLSSQGEGVALAFGTVVLAAAARLMAPGAKGRGDALAWGILGLAGGLGWWAGQIMGMLLIASALAVLVARPRALREPAAFAGVALFFVGSLSFWIWNAQHEWATFRHFLTWGQPLPGFGVRLSNVAGTLIAALQDGFWDGRRVRLPAAGRALGWALVWTVYVPAILLAAWRVSTWIRRLRQHERPWREPLDLVVLAFSLTAAAHLLTWFGTSGILRYSITFFATLPVLCAVVLARVWRAGRLGRAVAVVLTGVLLGYNALTHVLFVSRAASTPYRPVDAAIARLSALGVRACYAHSRIAQVITFESGERITCADYYGFRNFSFLQMVDAVDDPETVAIVTHHVLQNPPPEVMAATLRLSGAEVQRDEVGDYVIFHHIRPPDPRVHPIPSSRWSARASTRSEAAPLAVDRRVWTRWATSEGGAAWFELDLGRAYRLAQITLASTALDAPASLHVETSPDGRVWDTAAMASDILPGLHWWKGHPRVDESGRTLVRIEPRLARFVRITAQSRPGAPWSLNELFAYEVADRPWEPPGPATAAYAEAMRELTRWMDDPGGPHPKRTPVAYEHRRAQVRWAAVFGAANRALDLAPEWEDAHHLYRRALMLSGWSEALDGAVARARADGTWVEVVRWAELAETLRPGFWRSGRDEARAEALVNLGRAAEALAVRTAARPSLRPVRARFGSDLELTAVELPAEVRPGTRVPIRYAWRLVRPIRHDYTAFVHIKGEGSQLNQDHHLGGDYGTSRWAPGERTEETLTLVVSSDTPPGSYRVKVGVWLPWSGKRLRVTEADLPHTQHTVAIGTLTVTR